MAEVTDGRRAYAAAVALARSELQLNLPADSSVGIKSRCERILVAARQGGLDVRAYRLAWPLVRRRQ
jgi:hypothetical protein